MAEEPKGQLQTLISVGEIDSKIAAILAERRRLEEQLLNQRKTLDAKYAESQERKRIFLDKKTRYTKDERFLKDAQQKLVDRRKALTSLNDYKTQMAAEREIEAASKQLGLQEEGMLTALEAMEQLEKDLKSAEEAYTTLHRDFEILSKETQETFMVLDERLKEHHAQRKEIAPLLDRDSMRTYERIKDRFPMDAIVAVSGTNCSGCFLELGPQIIVEISKSKALVRCRGCGRILYLKGSKEE